MINIHILILILLLIISYLTLSGIWLGIAIGVFGGALAVIFGAMLYACIIWKLG